MHITTTHLGKLINIMVHIDIDHKHIVTRYNRVQPQKKPIHPHGHLYYISNQLIHGHDMSVLDILRQTEDQWNAHLALRDPNLLPLTG